MACQCYITFINLKHKEKKFQKLCALTSNQTGEDSGNTPGRLVSIFCSVFFVNLSYRGILVYNICLISISNSVSDGVTSKSVLNIESHSTINSASEYEPDVLNTFCATRV